MTSLALAVALLATSVAGLSGCSEYTEGAASTGYAFVQSIVSRDYAAAYDHVYSFTSDVKSKQDFVDRFENIYDALEITDVQLMERSVVPVTEDEYRLTYTLQLVSNLLGTLNYTYTAEIVSGPLGYNVLYAPSLILPMLEEGDKVRVQYQEGDRGEVFSADGKLLAKNDYAESVYIDLDLDPDIEEVKSVLAQLFGDDADPEKIQARYEQAVERERPVQVLMTFPRNTITEEENARISSVHGLGVDASSLTEKRYYPLGDNTAHMVGYLGSPTEDELAADEGLDESSLVGRSGIELAYEEQLRGNDGWRIYIENARGDVKEVLYEDPKTDGSDVYLTIDTMLQNKAYTLLQANCRDDQSGVIVIMDYDNGDVLAMANYPSFDPNLFNPVAPEVWKHYNDDPLTPMFARATQADYMPGSTFKIFTGVPAIREGLLSESTHVPLTIRKNANNVDVWNPGDDLNVSWGFPVITRTSTPNGTDYENAIKSSDNIFFAYWAIRTGIEPMKEYLESIGIGDAPDFELPVRASSYGNDSTDYNLHWLAQVGYGIGVSITPLQLACMYTALTNNGDILNPTIVEKISRTEGSEETIEWENARTVFREDAMDQRSIDMAKQAMRRVIVDGTAYAAQLSDISGLIAKTGTAQYDGKGREMNWIVCVNPNDSRIYLVMIDAKTDEGTAPKLAVLNGLLRSSTYSSALENDPQPAPTAGDEYSYYSPSSWGDSGSSEGSSGGSTGTEPSEGPSGGDGTGSEPSQGPGGDEPSGGDSSGGDEPSGGDSSGGDSSGGDSNGGSPGGGDEPDGGDSGGEGEG